MRNYIRTKGLILIVILLFTGINTVPSVRGNNAETHRISSVTVDDEKSLTEDISVPDCVEVGDLLFIDWKFDVGEDESNKWMFFGPYNDHCAIYIGNNTFVEAAAQGVRANDYSYFYYWTKNMVFLRVKTANESQKLAAAAWAISKIGLPYQVCFKFPWFSLKIANSSLRFPTAHEFYCSELLWAAYYNQGIDIDQNGWTIPWWATGNDILSDDNVEVIYKEVNNSTGIIKPNKGFYIANKKIISTFSKTIIFGDIDVEAVTYNNRVTRMDFYIDDIYQASDNTAPYIWNWNEKVSGKKVIKAVACDDDGNQYYTAITVCKYL
jgi:cell wall-associated NlpC family hydrolase